MEVPAGEACVNLQLADRIAVISGATGGLGPAVVRALVESGALVVATARNLAHLESLPTALGLPAQSIRPMAADATSQPSLAALRDKVLAEFGHVDILVNLAGGFRGGSVLTVSRETWEGLIALNATSLLLTCQAFVPGMVERGDGRVINVAAQSALRARKNNAAYAASKSAVLRFTEALAEEVQAHGVRVNAVLPGTIDTPDNRRSMPKADPSAWTPPEKIASVIRFLASDESGAIHGAAIPV